MGNKGYKKWCKNVDKKKIELKKNNIKKLSNQELLDNIHILLKKEKIMYNDKLNYRIFDSTIDEVYKRKLLKNMNLVDNKVESTKKLGKQIMMLSKEISIADPSYGSNKFIINPGLWYIYYHSWLSYPLPNKLVLCHKEYYDSKDIKYKYVKTGRGIGSDISTITVMNYKDLPNEKFKDETWWMKMSDLGNKQYKKFKDAYSIKTGYGDGNYYYTIGEVNNNIVKIIVHFI